MSKTQNFLLKTSHGDVTNLIKVLKLKNWTGYITSGFRPEY